MENNKKAGNIEHKHDLFLQRNDYQYPVRTVIGVSYGSWAAENTCRPMPKYAHTVMKL